MNIVLLAIRMAVFVPLSCFADCQAAYRDKLQETWFLVWFLWRKTTKEKRHRPRGGCEILICKGIRHEIDQMVIRKVDFQFGEINVDATKLPIDIEGTITIPNRFAATNESLFENFFLLLRGCEKYEAVGYKLNKEVFCQNFKPKEMELILGAFKSCFPIDKIYKIKLEESSTVLSGDKFVIIKSAEITPTFGNCFKLVFEYC